MEQALTIIRASIKEIMKYGGKKYSIDIKQQGWHHISLRLTVALSQMGYDVDLTPKEILHIKWNV